MRIFFLFIFLTVSVDAFSQMPKIVIAPENPANTDLITIDASVTLVDGCHVLDSTVTISDDTITLYACYVYGWFSGGTISYDTIHFAIGALPNGTYTFIYKIRATKGLSDSTCANYQLEDAVSNSITVGPTAVKDIGELKDLLATNMTCYMLTLTKIPQGSIDIFSLEGIKVLGDIKPSQTTIDVSRLPSGIYFLVLNTMDNRSITKFVKQ